MSNFDPVNYAELKALAAQLTAAIASINGNVDAAKTAMVNSNTAQTTTVNTATNAARDNVNGTAASYYNGLVAHVTNTAAAYDRAVRSIQTVINAGSTTYTSGSGGLGGTSYSDFAISAVNPAKTFVLPIKSTGGANGATLMYRLISGSAVRWEQFGYGGGPSGYGCIVVEFF